MNRRIVSLITSGLLLLGIISPVLAANVDISSNGADSYNKVKIKFQNLKSTTQTNSSSVSNLVGITSKTGGNKANKNTGGNVDITSGDVTTTIGISNEGGSNLLTNSEDCGCLPEEHTVTIQDNGADSTNKVKVKTHTQSTQTQTNLASILNGLELLLKTGFNQANKNTGSESDIDITSGDVTTDVTIFNSVNANVVE